MIRKRVDKEEVYIEESPLIKYIFKWLMIIAVILAVLSLMDRYNILKWPVNINLKFLPLLLFVQFCLIGLSVLAWKMLLQQGAAIRVSLMDSFAHLGVVFVGKYIPGKVWGALIRIKMLKNAGYEIPPVVGVSFLEQLMVLSSALLLGGTMYIYNQTESVLLALGVGIVGVCLLKPVLRLLGRLPKSIVTKFEERYVKTTEVLSSMSWEGQLSVFMMYMASWALNGAFMVLLALMLGVDLNIAQAFQIASAIVLSILIGFFAFFAPGGIGVREASFVALVGASVGYDNAVTLIVVHRAWITLLDCLWGVFSYWYCQKQCWL